MCLRERYIGDRKFYSDILKLTIPIMVQNAISNFVGLLDNLMIGRLGTNALSGVSIANQMMFIYYLLLFGATAGAGIFTAQYHGMKDVDGVRETFRFKIILNLILSGIAAVIFIFFGSAFIGAFLHGEGLASDAAATLAIGREYLTVMIVSMLPHSISMAYSGTLRDTGETAAPMQASFVAVFVNLIGNFILIYGYLGFPALGARGAAIATVISRFVELAILILYTHRNSEKHPFITGAYKTLKIRPGMAGKYLVKSLPLILNETLWSGGTTFLNQSYSLKSLNAVAACLVRVRLVT